MGVCRGGNGVVEKRDNGIWIYGGGRDALHIFDTMTSRYSLGLSSCLWQPDALDWLLYRLRALSPACRSVQYAVWHSDRRIKPCYWYLSLCKISLPYFLF